MGLFDIFGRSGGSLAKHAARAANKRAQNQDRWQSLRVLGEMGTPEAIEALLKRFTFRIDPSITDQEEKDLAMEGVLGAGEVAVEPLRAFLHSSDSVAWPVKLLAKLVEPAALTSELLALLEGMSTDYERDPQRKLDTLMHLEDLEDPRIVDAVMRFFEDSNESVRFHAVQTTLSQANAESAREALRALFDREESVRVRARVLEAFVRNDWSLGERPEAVDGRLPAGFKREGDRVKR